MRHRLWADGHTELPSWRATRYPKQPPDVATPNKVEADETSPNRAILGGAGALHVDADVEWRLLSQAGSFISPPLPTRGPLRRSAARATDGGAATTQPAAAAAASCVWGEHGPPGAQRRIAGCTAGRTSRKSLVTLALRPPFPR